MGSIDARQANIMSSYDGVERVGGDIASCELRKRSSDMQQALNAAMFGTPHALDRGRNSDRMNEEQLEEQKHYKIKKITEMLHDKLILKAENEVMLLKESMGCTTSEEVLLLKVKEEEALVASRARKLKQKAGEVQRMHTKTATRRVKLKAGEKTIMLLEMKIKDLNVEAAEIMNREHVKSARCRETNMGVRRLERELYDLKASSEKFSSAIEEQVENKDALFQKQTRMEDALLRAQQRAAMQAISLSHELTPLKLRCEEITFKCEDVKEEHDDIVEKIQIFQNLHELEKLELKKRIADEIESNEGLVLELSAKTTITRNLFMDLKEEDAAKKRIMTQLANKDGLCLQMGKRLYKIERVFLETSGALKQRQGQTNDLEEGCENMKSSVKILDSKLKKEQAATRKLTKWTQMERLTAEDLDIKLTGLQTNQVTYSLALGQEGALKIRLKEQLAEACESAKSYKKELHETAAEWEIKADKLKDLNLDVEHVQVRHAKVAAAVEKYGRMINERTRTFKAKAKQLLFATEEFEEQDKEQLDEVKRLQPQLDRGNSEVKVIENIIDANTRKSVVFRTNIAKVLGELDIDNQKLASGLRTVIQRNEIMEMNRSRGAVRIKEINIKMLQNTEIAAETSGLNNEEENLLEARLRSEIDKSDALTRVMVDDNRKLFSLQARLESEDHALRHAARDTRESRNQEPAMIQSIESYKESKMEQEKQIEGLIAMRGRLQIRSDSKEDSCAKTQFELKTAQDTVDVLRQEIHDAEVSEADFFSAEKIDKVKIHAMENEIALQEEQHNMDTNIVKLKIIQLQDALKEKVATLKKLEYVQARALQHNRSLELRQMQSATEVAQTHKTFEKMLDEERRKVAFMRNLVETQTRENVTIRQEDMVQEESLQAMEIKLNMSVSVNDCLVSESYRKGRSLNNDSIAFNKINHEERELMERNLDLQERHEMLTIHERENTNNERALQRTLSELLNENKRYKLEVLEKMKNERHLLLQVEAERAGIHRSTGHPDSERHAEEAMIALLHVDSASPLQ